VVESVGNVMTVLTGGSEEPEGWPIQEPLSVMVTPQLVKFLLNVQVPDALSAVWNVPRMEMVPPDVELEL
jgi:hypothetical protein